MKNAIFKTSIPTLVISIFISIGSSAAAQTATPAQTLPPKKAQANQQIAKQLPAKKATVVKKDAPSRPAQAGTRANSLPGKLPAKAPVLKRTYIDFSENDKVAARRDSPLERALTKSESDVTTIRPRSIIAAPQGDSAEPMANFSREVTQRPQERAQERTAVRATPSPAPTPMPEPEIDSEIVLEDVDLIQKPEVPATLPLAQKPPKMVPTPVAPYEASRPNRPFENFKEFSSPPIVVPRTVARPLPILENEKPKATEIAPAEAVASQPEPVRVLIETAPEVASEIQTSATNAPEREGFLKSIAPATMTFVRTGYYNANYKKFDDRMKNGASMLGLGAARGFETSWGAFEARAAVDIYHAMDQSVTIDNIRMMSVRTEVAYFLSHSRVKPGLSLGLGWADYSIRSYRAISGSSEDVVTLRTHAKGKAFSVIPATSLRIEIAKELVVDVQTEFMALLGGESPDAAQGLGLNVGLGWAF